MLRRPDADAIGEASGAADDHLAICDALLRFASGVDSGDGSLLASAFAPDAVIDFGPCGRMLGFDFPRLEGRDAIVGFLAATAAKQTTTHAVTNLRSRRVDEGAVLSALVEATHIARDEAARRLRMMTRYTAELVRHDELWRLRRMVIVGAWFEGDAGVLLTR